jgi:AcrR family transcriptional regulator
VFASIRGDLDMTQAIAGARVRRVPQQDRSRDKLRRLLDAADGLLAREGGDALATTRVAAAAGIAVGSLYAYFPDKDAIAEALALRYWGEIERRIAAVVEADERDPLADPTGALLDAVAEGFRTSQGFRALWFSALRTERLRDSTRPARVTIGALVERLLARHWPDADAAERATVARMYVLAGDGLLREAFRLDPDGEPTVLIEGHRMLDAYIIARLGEARA